MGQSSVSGFNFSLWFLVRRHICFLTFLQPADKSKHNADAQIGSRGCFLKELLVLIATVLFAAGDGGEKNSISYLSLKTWAESSIGGNDN